MTTATCAPTRRLTTDSSIEPSSLPTQSTPRRVPAGPVLAMAAGIVVLAAAALMTTSAIRSDQVRPGRNLPATADADSRVISLAEQDVSVVVQVYEPGHDSGWHSHPGIHAVAVVVGALTVYDRECRATTFGPGQPYVGGRDLHLVRNETAAPVEMIVTYLSPSTPNDSTRHLDAPAGCVVPQ